MLSTCSSDDDGNIKLTNEEKLITGSPWIFSTAEIIKIYDDPDVFLPDLQQSIMEIFNSMGLTFTFSNNNHLIINIYGDDLQRTYSFPGLDKGEDNFTINVSGSDNPSFKCTSK